MRLRVGMSGLPSGRVASDWKRAPLPTVKATMALTARAKGGKLRTRSRTRARMRPLSMPSSWLKSALAGIQLPMPRGLAAPL